jgi:hypothetical protein
MNMKDNTRQEEQPLTEKRQQRGVYWATGIFLTAAAAGIVIYMVRKMSRRRKLRIISNAGYETAHDIHYPLKHNRPGKGQKRRSTF